ncbi:hypothetical protein OsccyDRAFT_2947 [Leptolyngbyaceae cyanobacterium JSC-12]|nr:hypothetical protein OsccyDRAFT_2947 [Leptolyngbyaceae cyanobacterium JSC-12]
MLSSKAYRTPEKANIAKISIVNTPDLEEVTNENRPLDDDLLMRTHT